MNTQPADFDAYWQYTRDDLAAYPMSPELELLPLRSTDFATLYSVRLTSVGPYRLFGYLSIPKGDGPFPAIYYAPKYQSVLEIIPQGTANLQRSAYITFCLAARGQRNALTLRPANGVLDRCVEEVLNPFLPNLEQQGIRVETDLNAPGPFPFDPDAVTQITANLLNNVEKYAAEGGHLLVTTRREGDDFLLEVCESPSWCSNWWMRMWLQLPSASTPAAEIRIIC